MSDDREKMRLEREAYEKRATELLEKIIPDLTLREFSELPHTSQEMYKLLVVQVLLAEDERKAHVDKAPEDQLSLNLVDGAVGD
jgi:hypothetical protein